MESRQNCVDIFEIWPVIFIILILIWRACTEFGSIYLWPAKLIGICFDIFRSGKNFSVFAEIFWSSIKFSLTRSDQISGFS